MAFPDGQRHYVSLHRDEYVDVWLLCWTRSNDTGWHDHDISSGAVAVVNGVLKECNPRIGGAHVEVAVGAGESFCFGPEHIHRLVGAAAPQRLHPRLLSAAVAAGAVLHQRGRRDAPRLGELRGRIAPPERCRLSRAAR